MALSSSAACDCVAPSASTFSKPKLLSTLVSPGYTSTSYCTNAEESATKSTTGSLPQAMHVGLPCQHGVMAALPTQISCAILHLAATRIVAKGSTHAALRLPLAGVV